MSRRSQGKTERRERIVVAARSMIMEAGGDGFSMRALAERADVSLVTPYNLFGSKAGVITALLDAEVQSLIARVEQLPQYFVVDRLFHIVEETRNAYRQHEPYFRYMLRMSYDSPDTDKYITMRDAYILACIEDAARIGEVTASIPHNALAKALSALYAGNLLAYSMGRSTLDEVTLSCRTGFALLLLSVAPLPLANYIRGRFDISAGDLSDAINVVCPK